MKIFKRTNLIKVLILFSVGFIFRIIIYQYFDVNVFLDYTSSISILYYISLSSLSVYLDELFSFNYIISNNIKSINIKTFNDLKTSNLSFTKDFSTNTLSNQYQGHQPFYHKIRCKLS